METSNLYWMRQKLDELFGSRSPLQKFETEKNSYVVVDDIQWRKKFRLGYKLNKWCEKYDHWTYLIHMTSTRCYVGISASVTPHTKTLKRTPTRSEASTTTISSIWFATLSLNHIHIFCFLCNHTILALTTVCVIVVSRFCFSLCVSAVCVRIIILNRVYVFGLFTLADCRAKHTYQRQQQSTIK